MIKRNILFILMTTMLSLRGFSNPIDKNKTDSTAKHSFYAGFRFEKAAGFYWYNGITAEYTSKKMGHERIGLGFNYLHSGFGSALSSNAIPFYEIDLSGIYYLRHNKTVKPSVRLNIGYAHADYGSDIFNSIPDHSMILSLEAGVLYDFHFPLRISLGGGYNLISGNGIKGLGTLFPIYIHSSVFYRINCSGR